MSDLPSLEEKVAYLRSAELYGAGTGTADTLETHWSWLFLTATRVLKFKKPLWRPWVDLTTLEARRANCSEELRLNRRLTEGIYRRLVPLWQLPDGLLSLRPGGRIVEWLIEMDRLPASRMLDELVRNGRVRDEEIRSIGLRLAEFYSGQPPIVADGGLYFDHLETEAAENRHVLSAADIGMPPAAVADILDGVARLQLELKPAIEERVAAGRIVEGHGDLRPEHVCVVKPVQIFDCLEFDRSMRILDPFDEVNYLGLECAVLGPRWIRTELLAILDNVIGGYPPRRLMAFYSAFRATLRARICLAHLDDPEPMEPERWPAEARAYLRFAEAELGKL